MGEGRGINMEKSLTFDHLSMTGRYTALPTYVEYNFKNKILFQNVRSLRGNYNKIKDLIYNSSPDIIAMSETWCPHEWQFYLDGYHKLEAIERRGSIINKGGGVGVYVKKPITFTILEKEVSPDLEYILINTKSELIGNFYRPPKGDFNKFVEKMRQLLQKYTLLLKKHLILFGGDFNIDHLKTKHHYTQEINSTMSEYGLGNIIKTPTRITETTETLIDVIYSNDSTIEGHTVVTDISDHLGVTEPLHRTKNKRQQHRQEQPTLA